MHAAQQQRVVGDQQVGSPGDGLVDHGLHRVDGEQHPAYRLLGVSGDQADRVPVLRPPRVVEAVEHAERVGEGDASGHAGPRTWNGRTQSSWLSPSIDSFQVKRPGLIGNGGMDTTNAKSMSLPAGSPTRAADLEGALGPHAAAVAGRDRAAVLVDQLEDERVLRVGRRSTARPA